MGRKKHKEQFIELEIESIAFQGLAVARSEGIVYFVKGAVPGDKVIARVTRKKSRYREAEVTEIIERSPDRIEAECKYFGTCGGCSWQHLDYQKQLFWKKQHVIDAFERIAKIDVGEYRDTLSSPKVFNYRNKMEFSFGASRWLTSEEIASDSDIEDKHFALGLHIPGRFDKVLDIDSCLIQSQVGNGILNDVRELAQKYDIEPYHQRAHKGFLRNLVLRNAEKTEQMMVILVTNEPAEESEKEFIRLTADMLKEKYPVVTSFVHTVNAGLAQVATGVPHVIFGSGLITEKIFNIDYQISPNSFFQTNSSQLDNFIGEIIQAGDVGSGNTVWDLYCGTGSITLPLAGRCKNVLGIEIVQSAVDDAKINAEINKIENAEFMCADLHAKETIELLQMLPKPDIVFIDPPRAGMHKSLAEHLLALEIDKIVYVSCNPATQARDCEILSEKYHSVFCRPVDMFPHTFHVENIALLKKK